MIIVQIDIDQVFIRLMLRGELERRKLYYWERCRSLGNDCVQWYFEIEFEDEIEAAMFKLRDWPLFVEKYS